MLTALAGCDIDALVFVAEMYGVQLDQLAVVLGVPVERARRVAARWRNLGLAESARLGPGPPWVWVTRTGLAACGLRYPDAPPASSRLALQATTACQRARASWHGERRILAEGQGGFLAHPPDGELHWPHEAAVSWAGECWAIQAVLARTAAACAAGVMRDLLARAGAACPSGRPREPGRPPRYTRALYLCSPAALPAVVRARDDLGPASARIEIRNLPAEAALPLAPAGPGPAMRVNRRPAVQDAAVIPGVSSVRR
jgi:hypothetical protein